MTSTVSTQENAAPLHSKTARQAKIVELINSSAIGSQAQLAAGLADHGFVVTQGTLSRDLVELGAVRVRDHGASVYRVASDGADPAIRPGEWGAFDQKLAKLLPEVLISAEASANLVIVRTPPGAAQYLASALDRASWHEILGTIAGDDTIMVITRDSAGGQELGERLRSIAGHAST